MTDEEFDDALDELSPKKRRQVLRLVGDDETMPVKRLPMRIVAGRTLGVIFAVVIGMPIVLVGMIMTVSVVLAPFGFPLMFIGAWPLYRLIKRWVRMSVE